MRHAPPLRYLLLGYCSMKRLFESAARSGRSSVTIVGDGKQPQ